MANFMIFMLSCMLIHAFLTHYFMLVFTEKHQIFFMKMALSNETIFRSWIASTIFVSLIFSWVIASFWTSLSDVWCFTFSPYIWKSLWIRHFFEFTLCESGFLWIVRNCLAQRTFVKLWALQVIEEEFVIFLIDEIFNIMSESTFLTFGTDNSEFSIKGRHSFRNFNILSTLKAHLVITDKTNRCC